MVLLTGNHDHTNFPAPLRDEICYFTTWLPRLIQLGSYMLVRMRCDSLAFGQHHPWSHKLQPAQHQLCYLVTCTTFIKVSSCVRGVKVGAECCTKLPSNNSCGCIENNVTLFAEVFFSVAELVFNVIVRLKSYLAQLKWPVKQHRILMAIIIVSLCVGGKRGFGH